jgi:hypothetical protein
MSDTGRPDQPDQPDRHRETDWERRKRLAAVFGDVLPDTTRDERDREEPSVGEKGDRGDDWLRRQVPPHHG